MAGPIVDELKGIDIFGPSMGSDDLSVECVNTAVEGTRVRKVITSRVEWRGRCGGAHGQRKARCRQIWGGGGAGTGPFTSEDSKDRMQFVSTARR